MKNLGNPEVTADLEQTIIRGVTREAGNRSVKQVAEEENEILLALINQSTKGASESISAKKGDQM